MKIKMEPQMEHAQQDNCLLTLDCQELKYIAVTLHDLEVYLALPWAPDNRQSWSPAETLAAGCLAVLHPVIFASYYG